ncbi:hypothetical protein Tco_0628982 [Tanacetum coccineum]|uniref:Uncharacterized protein n=1 Tax=Tanacetum coccineum TaxID=301880 RepID=A0ABQ4WS20_9ASTR
MEGMPELHYYVKKLGGCDLIHCRCGHDFFILHELRALAVASNVTVQWQLLTFIATIEIMDGYVMPKYGNKNMFEDDSWIDIIMDDVYHTFYRDEEEEETKVAKASEDMKLSIMKEKFLAMVESEKARVKDYTKLVVTDGMVDYVLEKYGNKWKFEDEIAYVILEDLRKGKGKLVVLCLIALFAPNAPNAPPPSTTRKRKPT